MAGYIRLPRDSEEIDRRLVGGDIHSSTSKKPSVLFGVGIHFLVRLFIFSASFSMIILSGVEMTAHPWAGNGMVFAGPWPSLLTSVVHLLYYPLFSRTMTQAETCQQCKQHCQKARAKGSMLAKGADAFASVFIFIASMVSFAGSMGYRDISLAAAVLGLVTSLVLMLLVIFSGSRRLQVHISFAGAEDIANNSGPIFQDQDQARTGLREGDAIATVNPQPIGQELGSPKS